MVRAFRKKFLVLIRTFRPISKKNIEFIQDILHFEITPQITMDENILWENLAYIKVIIVVLILFFSF